MSTTIEAKKASIVKQYGFTTIASKDMLFKNSTFEPMITLIKKSKKYLDSLTESCLVGSVKINSLLFRTESDSDIRTSYLYKIAKEQGIKLVQMSENGVESYKTPDMLFSELTKGEEPLIEAKLLERTIKGLENKTDAFIIGVLTGIAPELYQCITGITPIINEVLKIELNELLLQKCNNLISIDGNTKLPVSLIGDYNLYFVVSTTKKGDTLRYLKVVSGTEL